MEKAWELLKVVHQRFCNTHHTQQTIAHAVRYIMSFGKGIIIPSVSVLPTVLVVEILQISDEDNMSNALFLKLNSL